MARVRLTWPVNPAEQLVTAYKVWEGFANPGNPTLVQTVAGAVSSVEIDVSSGRFAWAVSAVNLAGESSRSPWSYSPTLPSAPGAPTIEIVTP